MLTCPALRVLRIQMRQEPGTVTKDFRAQWYLTQAPKTRWGTPKPKGWGTGLAKGGYIWVKVVKTESADPVAFNEPMFLLLTKRWEDNVICHNLKFCRGTNRNPTSQFTEHSAGPRCPNLEVLPPWKLNNTLKTNSFSLKDSRDSCKQPK